MVDISFQFLNSGALVNRGMGTIVHYEDITEDSITKAIAFALDDKTQENAKKVSYSFRNRLNSPLETAIWWAEHVAATGGAGLVKPYGTNLPGYIYHSFDIYTVLVGGFVAVLAIFFWAIQWCCCRQRPNFETKLKIN